MHLSYIKLPNDEFTSINDILKRYFNFSTTLKNKLIKAKKIFVNGNFVNTNLQAKPFEVITIELSYKEDNSNIIPCKMKLDILYEDDWLLILNKPSGIAVHPSFSYHSNTLSNGVRYYFDKINLKKKVRPVNRLDFNTSGIIVFAKCEYIHERLIYQMTENIFKKEYLCFCENSFDTLNTKHTISKPIARKENSIIERCICEIGAPATTHYIALDNFDNYSLVRCFLETGRTHQIRVHFASINHPLIGDTLYGNASNYVQRQALHSNYIEFIHPVSNEKIEISSNLPDDLACLLIR